MNDVNKYQRLIESLGNEYFFYSHNMDGKYLYISPSVETVLGYTVEEAYGGLVKHMTDSELNKETIKTLKKSASGTQQKTFELELFTKSRDTKVIEITESPLLDDKGELISVEGVAHDITERKRQEEIIQRKNEELRAHEEELRQNLEEMQTTNEYISRLKQDVDDQQKLLLRIINEIPEKIFLKDDKGKFIIANNLVAANYGLSPEELIGKSDFDFYPKEQAEQKFEREQEILKTGIEISHEEGDFKKEDKLIVRSRLKPFKIDTLNITGLLGIQIDITQIRKSEIRLSQMNKALKSHEIELSQNLAEMTQTKTELENTIQNLKDTQSQLVQSEKMGALGHLIAGIAHEINTPIGAINASVDNISASLDSSMQNLFTLFTKLRKDELVVFLRIMKLIEDKSLPLTSKEKRQFKKEIRAKLEEQQIENSYSIADLLIYLNLHKSTDKIVPLLKINNPEFVLKSIKDIYSVRKNSENIKLAVDKASKVVFALKKFTHKDQGGDKEKASLVDNIETVLTLQHNFLKQGIEVIREYDEVPLVNCYADELVQVWTNLISNSIQAMNNTGTLCISIKNLGEKVKVSIEDTGIGIPKEIQQKIFEPFFTTKKAGEGTGIGLDLVAKIVEKHGAILDLESEVGKGTKFTVTLPIN